MKTSGRLRSSTPPFEDTVDALGVAFGKLQDKAGKMFLTEEFEEADRIVIFHWLEWNRKRTRVHLTDDKPRRERRVTVESDDPQELEETYDVVAKQLDLVPITDEENGGEARST